MIKPGAKDFSAADAVNASFHWILEDVAVVSNFQQPKGTAKQTTSCTCMLHFLSEPGESDTTMIRLVAEYMVHFAAMKRELKREVVNEWWMKVSALLKSMDESNKTRTYMLPGLPGDKNEVSHKVCRNTIQRLLNLGRRMIWETAAVNPSKSDARLGKLGLESCKQGKNNGDITNMLSLKNLKRKGLHLPHAWFVRRLG